MRRQKRKHEREYVLIKIDEFMAKYPSIETFANDMRTRKDGRPIRVLNGHLLHLKTLCDTLKLCNCLSNAFSVSGAGRLLQVFR